MRDDRPAVKLRRQLTVPLIELVSLSQDGVLGPSGNILLELVPKTLYAYGTTLEVGIRKGATGRSNHKKF